MLSKLKKFDVHTKVVDGVNQQTVLGAILTVVSVILVVILLVSEISVFMKVDVASRMVADNTAGIESVKLEIDIEFLTVSCDKINFFQEVTRGTLHIHEKGDLEKRLSQNNGCRIVGNILTDKVGGNFRFSVDQPSDSNAQIFHAHNLSHNINHIAFMPTNGLSAVNKIQGLSNILNDQYTSVPENTGIYQYSIQVQHTLCAHTKLTGLCRLYQPSTRVCMGSCHSPTSMQLQRKSSLWTSYIAMKQCRGCS